MPGGWSGNPSTTDTTRPGATDSTLTPYPRSSRARGSSTTKACLVHLAEVDAKVARRPEPGVGGQDRGAVRRERAAAAGGDDPVGAVDRWADGGERAQRFTSMRAAVDVRSLAVLAVGPKVMRCCSASGTSPAEGVRSTSRSSCELESITGDVTGWLSSRRSRAVKSAPSARPPCRGDRCSEPRC